MVEPFTLEGLGQQLDLSLLIEKQRRQLNLLEACVAAGRGQWAHATAEELQKLAAATLTLLPATPVEAKPARVYTPPTAAQVQFSLEKMFAQRKPVGDDDPLVIVTFNGHLLDIEKVKRLLEPLKWFIARGHIFAFQETNRDALKFLSQETSYGLNVSHRNERGQAVGILFHPRIEWLGEPIYHDYLCDIPGHPDWKESMRPAVQRKVRDKYSGLEFDIVDVHSKSNLGGVEETRPVRLYQFEKLMEHLEAQTQAGSLGRVLLAGDMNTPIDSAAASEIAPLQTQGFKLVANALGRSTYFFKGEPKGQFDGFFARGLDELSPVWIPELPEKKGERWFYGEFSDHLPAFVELPVSKLDSSAVS